MLEDHAYARTMDGNLPIIGVPAKYSLMTCDLCNDEEYWLDVKLNAAGNQFLCLTCRGEVIGMVGKHKLIVDDT
jgi:hypothetical protein